MTAPTNPAARAQVSAPSDWDSLVACTLPPSRWVAISQARIQQFAECVDDEQWIHVDAERARSGPFSRTVAHGFLTLSMITMLLEDVLDASGIPFTLNYGLDRVRFPAPVPSDSHIRGSFTVASAKPVEGGVQVTLDATITCDAATKPVCVATLLLRFYESVSTAS